MRALTRSWSFALARAPQAYWPLLADTSRYNEVLGVPRHQVRDELQSDGRVRFFGEMRVGVFDIAWEDLPPNWVTNAWQEHVRHFSRGPFSTLAARLHLQPEGDGSRLVYTLSTTPTGLASALFCRVFLARSGAGFASVVASVRRFVEDGAEKPFDYRPPPPSPGARARAHRYAEALETTPYGHGLATRLADHLLDAQEVDLGRLRPLALARAWQAPPRDCVELALAAARAGLLEARWQLLCPRCRVAKTQVAHLEQLPEEAHCSTCNIRYDRDYARNVELAFAPAASIRAVERGEFCWLGPMNTPHVAAQITLQPGEKRVLDVPLGPGNYRLRTLEAGPEAVFDWPGEAFPALRVTPDACEPAPADLAPGTLCNEAPVPLTLMVERRDWLRDALTAQQATTLQAFRDLFSAEVLRPGDDVEVSQVTFMFTDLAGSTALYERIGDAAAYRRVREHFAVLARIVRRHDGGIVKTRGDGVHAAFVEPADALRAALEIQQRFAEDGDEALSGLRVRIGLHTGPSIAVTIDGRLDYYGTTVNTAARLEAKGEGADIVLSEALVDDPLVAAVLGDVRPEPMQVTLKGLAGQHAVRRLPPDVVLVLARRLQLGENATASPPAAGLAQGAHRR